MLMPYYFSTHGCSLFFSGCAGALEDVTAAAASFWRALMSKKFAMFLLLLSVIVVFPGNTLTTGVSMVKWMAKHSRTSDASTRSTSARFGKTSRRHFQGSGRTSRQQRTGYMYASTWLQRQPCGTLHSPDRTLDYCLFIASLLSCETCPPTPTPRHE